MDKETKKPQPENKDAIKQSWVMARTLIVSMIFIKTLFLYFGLKYAEYPDEGYGYGLAITGCLSVINIALFFWKIRHYKFD